MTLGWLHAQTAGWGDESSQRQRQAQGRQSPKHVACACSHAVAARADLLAWCASRNCHLAVCSNPAALLRAACCCLLLSQNNVKVPQEIQSFITGATFSTLVSLVVGCEVVGWSWVS